MRTRFVTWGKWSDVLESKLFLEEKNTATNFIKMLSLSHLRCQLLLEITQRAAMALQIKKTCRKNGTSINLDETSTLTCWRHKDS